MGLIVLLASIATIIMLIWMMFFGSKTVPDILIKIKRGLSNFTIKKDIDIEKIKEYLSEVYSSLIQGTIPGSEQIFVKDVVDGTLFIPPKWKYYGKNVPNKDTEEGKENNLINKIIELTNNKNSQILILGQPGQGKTTTLKRLFVEIKKRYENKSLDTIPVFINLRDIAHQQKGNFGSSLKWVWEYLASRITPHFPLNFNEFTKLAREGKIIFLLDGFDEISERMDQQTINKYLDLELFSYKLVLTCRLNFFELYLNVSQFSDKFKHKIVLLPFSEKSVKLYIKNYCNMFNLNHNDIISSIRKRHSLWRLVTNPLILTMILEIYAFKKEDILKKLKKKTLNAAAIYSEYTEMWLRHEATKPDTVLKWEDKERVLEWIAWGIYDKSIEKVAYVMSSITTFTRYDVEEITRKLQLDKYMGRDLHTIVDDICLRTFLISEHGGYYYFIHKSIQDYYVARYALNTLKSGNQKLIEAVLRYPFPVHIAQFLKELLDNLEENEKIQITKILAHVYESNLNNSDARSISIRGNTVYYMARLNTVIGIDFLKRILNEERDKFVQRNIIMGLVLFCGYEELLEEYIKTLENDDEARSINLGFHLVYYGDQFYEKGYKDAGDSKCDATVRAILRHLRSDNHRRGWPLDLFTFRDLIKSSRKRREVIQKIGAIDEILKILDNIPNNLKSELFKKQEHLLREEIKKLFK